MSCRERPPGLPPFVRHAFAFFVPLLVPRSGRGSLPAELIPAGRLRGRANRRSRSGSGVSGHTSAPQG